MPIVIWPEHEEAAGQAQRLLKKWLAEEPRIAAHLRALALAHHRPGPPGSTREEDEEELGNELRAATLGIVGEVCYGHVITDYIRRMHGDPERARRLTDQLLALEQPWAPFPCGAWPLWIDWAELLWTLPPDSTAPCWLPLIESSEQRAVKRLHSLMAVLEEWLGAEPALCARLRELAPPTPGAGPALLAEIIRELFDYSSARADSPCMESQWLLQCGSDPARLAKAQDQEPVLVSGARWEQVDWGSLWQNIVAADLDGKE